MDNAGTVFKADIKQFIQMELLRYFFLLNLYQK